MALDYVCQSLFAHLDVIEVVIAAHDWILTLTVCKFTKKSFGF